MSEQPMSSDPNAQRVRLWMQAGLDSYLKKDMGRWAFRPFEHYIGVRDDLAEDLRAIYDDLAPDDQGLWRSAIRDILAMQGRDPSRGSATRVLIDLAALVRAHEVLDVLPTLVAGTDSFLDQVVRTAIALASQTDATRTCLERIHTSPSFSADYAGLILRALCHVDPDGWLDHVENLAQAMSILVGQLEDDSTKRFYARDILDAVSLSRLRSAHLKRLGAIANSTWLLNEWFSGPCSLLHYEPKAESGPRLSLRAKSAVSIKLDEPLPPLLPSIFAQHHSTDDVVTVVIRAGRRKTWVAGYRENSVTELLNADTYVDAIELTSNYLDNCMQTPMHGLSSNFLASQLTEQPPSAGVAFWPSRGEVQHWIGPIDVTASLDMSLNTLFERLLLFAPYRDRISPTNRRTAIHNRKASEAVALAFRLAETPAAIA